MMMMISSSTAHLEPLLPIEISSSNSLSLAPIRHLWIPSVLKSSTTPSIHQSLGLCHYPPSFESEICDSLKYFIVNHSLLMPCQL